MVFQCGMCYNVEKCQIGECDMGKRIGLNVYGLTIVSGDRFIELHKIGRASCRERVSFGV